VTDHAALTGLGNDDHPQYLLAGVRDAADGFVVTGTVGTGTLAASGAGTRFVWYPRRAALRAGRVGLDQWDDANIGNYSVAMGLNTIASADYSVAMGLSTTASGGQSFAVGYNTVASANRAVAMGVATTASGLYSTALGSSTTASGNIATATGYNTTASGLYATSMGGNTTASGTRSTAMGESTTAQASMSLAIGRYNVVAGDEVAWLAADPLFVAGNGTGDASRSNALTLLKNGNLTIAGTLTQNSDIRLKEDVEPVRGALDGLLGLTPIRYRVRAGTGHPTERQIGLSAQEVERVFPELVIADSEGNLSVAYANLTALLIRALQEQQVEIDLLRSELDGLRAGKGASQSR
jgi:hypothetical protein